MIRARQMGQDGDEQRETINKYLEIKKDKTQVGFEAELRGSQGRQHPKLMSNY